MTRLSIFVSALFANKADTLAPIKVAMIHTISAVISGKPPSTIWETAPVKAVKAIIIASITPSTMMGSFSVFMTTLLGIKFILKPVMTTKEQNAQKSAKQKAIQSVLCGMIIGFICGFIGAGGGMMLLLILSKY